MYDPRMRRGVQSLKWITLGLTLILIAAYAATTSRCIAWIGTSRAFGFGEGVVWWKTHYTNPPSDLGWYIGHSVDRGVPGWEFKSKSAPNAFFGLLRTTPYTYELRLRSLLPFCAVLTVLLWWASMRPRPPYLCRACRYDLRGTPTGADRSRRCPECGALNERNQAPANTSPPNEKPPARAGGS
jgi:hypothetical protein